MIRVISYPNAFATLDPNFLTSILLGKSKQPLSESEWMGNVCKGQFCHNLRSGFWLDHTNSYCWICWCLARRWTSAPLCSSLVFFFADFARCFLLRCLMFPVPADERYISRTWYCHHHVSLLIGLEIFFPHFLSLYHAFLQNSKSFFSFFVPHFH